MEDNATLQHLLRSTDEHGRFTFSTEDQSYLEREEGQTFQEFMGAHVVWFMDEYSGFLTRFETSKSSTRSRLRLSRLKASKPGRCRSTWPAWSGCRA
jgi:hypothetical protein